MTISIQSIKANVRKTYLYDCDPNVLGVLPCKIIAISAYRGSPLTFTILAEDSYIFSDIPIKALFVDKEVIGYSLKALSYLLCPSDKIEVFTLDYLLDKNVSCYLKYGEKWEDGQYIMSVEFPNDNELLHLVKLDMGNFAFIPNHKMNCCGIKELSDYKKSHQKYLF